MDTKGYDALCEHEEVFYAGIDKSQETLSFYGFLECVKCGELSLPTYNHMEYAINSHLNAPDISEIIRNRGFRSVMKNFERKKFEANSDKAISLANTNNKLRRSDLKEWLKLKLEFHQKLSGKTNFNRGSD